jgi:hypothetical protein
MLTTEFKKAIMHDCTITCDYCQAPAVITMNGYGDSETSRCNWCADCAMQPAQKIMEDLCELLTAGGRHG